MPPTQVLTDEMQARIEPLLPPLKGAMGRPRSPYRPLVDGAIYRLRTGMAWRDLPREFEPWQTVWKRHDEFAHDGTRDKVLTALQSHADATGQIGGLATRYDWYAITYRGSVLLASIALWLQA